jgi:flavodoxin
MDQPTLTRHVPKTLIILKSIHHQNTAKVVATIAEVLKADVVAPEDTPAEILRNYDLVGFASGIYFGRFHSAIRSWVDRLEPSTLASPRSAFFVSTAGVSSLQRIWHWPLKKKLTRMGFTVIGEYCCRGHDTVGPLILVGGLNRHHPDGADLARAAAFAQQLSGMALATGISQEKCPEFTGG